jgi:hypothetical protein
MSTGGIEGMSALQAYRADLPLGGTDPSANDGAAIMIGTLLRQSLLSTSDDAAGSRIRGEASAMARASLGAAVLAQGCTYDDHPAEADVDVFRLLAQRTEHTGWLNLAQHLLESTEPVCADPIVHGRLVFDRARIWRKRGFLDISEAQSEELLRHAKRIGSAELQARAHGMLASIAQSRGNIVVAGKHSAAQLAAARSAGTTRLTSAALEGLGVAAGIRGDYNAAVHYLWSAYDGINGSGILALAVLNGLAQALLVSGHPEDALRMWTVQLNGGPPMHLVMPAVGGIAIVSAQLGDAAGVAWAAEQIRQLAKHRHHQREIAGALLECALALDAVGNGPQAGVLRRRAEAIAVARGYHDLTFSDSPTILPVAARQRFHGAAARAKEEIDKMEVPALPAQLRVAGV